MRLRPPTTFRRMASDAADLPVSPPDDAVITDADIADLPPPAQRYLRYMNVVDRPRDWSFRAHFTGRFRRRPDQRWLPCEGWQYNSGLEIARVFHMRLTIGGVLPMFGRDVYRHGRGRMHGTLLGLITVADGSGPEYDIGELVTYLNDAVLLAPSMLLRLPTTWAPVDDDAFELALTDGGTTVTAIVTVDEHGAPRDFSTTDRFCDLDGTPTRTRWSTPVDGWTSDGPRPTPVRASAVWHLPDGPFPYADFRFPPAQIRHNEPPPTSTGRR